MNYVLPEVNFDLTSPADEVMEKLRSAPDRESGLIRYAQAMTVIHLTMKKHPSYELAYYCAAMSGLGDEPHHAIFAMHSESLIHEVLDAFEVVPGSIPWDLLHYAMEQARNMAASGALSDDSRFASFISEAAQSEMLALINGDVNPDDFN